MIDRMLPKRDGLSVIGCLRDKGIRTPVLILSALGQVDDRIKGLRAGGDDYLPKPYSFAELLARVEVLSRRHGGRAEETVYRVGDLELDRLSHRVARGGEELTLQPREFRLLEYLMKHAGQVVTRTMLLENVWDYHFDPQTNVIDVHVSRLRSKIDKGFEQRARNLRLKNHQAKLVVCMLTLYVDGDGFCFVSIPALADDTGRSCSTSLRYTSTSRPRQAPRSPIRRGSRVR